MGFFDTIGLVATGLNSANAEVERLRKLDQEQADLGWERAQKFANAKNIAAAKRAFEPTAKLYGLNMPDFKNGTVTEQVAAPGVGNATPPDQMPSSGLTPPAPRFGLNPSFGGAASLPDLPKLETIGLTRDSGQIDEDDPGNQEKARRFFGMSPPKLTERDPYKDLMDEQGNVVRRGEPNPYKATWEQNLGAKREGWQEAEERARMLAGYSMDRTRYTTGAANVRQDRAIAAGYGRQDRGFDHADASQSRVFAHGDAGRKDAQAFTADQNALKAQRAAEAAAKKAAAATAAAEKKMKDKRAVEASQASFVMARVIGNGVPGVNVAAIGDGGVISLNLPRGANGGEDQAAAQAVAATARSHGYKFTPGANGRPATLTPFPGAHAASLRQSLADPKMVWDRQGGVETRVVDKPGVKRDPPPPKPAAAKPPRVWTTADEAKVDAEFARQWENRHPRAMGGYRGDPKDRAEEERTMRETIEARYKAAPEFGGSAAPEDPGAELLRRVRERDEARKKKRGGK